MASFRIVEDDTGIEVAAGQGEDEHAVFYEGMHYHTVYNQDGPHTMYFSNNALERRREGEAND